MKLVLTLLTIGLLSATANAEAPSKETFQLTRALINNPQIVNQLKEKGIDSLVNLQISQVKPGVNEYAMQLERNCECIPGTANVKILEDLTPTYADGPIKYESSISISTGF